MNTIIVIGATGTIGAHAALDLKQHGYEIVAVGRRLNDNDFFAKHGVQYISADICNAEDFHKLPNKCHSVLHFAGAMPSKMSGYHPAEYVQSICLGSLNVLEYCRRSNASRIVFTHTRADTNYLMSGTVPIPSNAERKFPPTGDHSVYTICKNMVVDLIEHYYYQYQLRRFVLRLPTVYVYHPNKYYYVNGTRRIKAYRRLIEQAMRGENIEIWGDPQRKKEILYIKDLLQMVHGSITADIDGGIYNAGRGVGVTLEEQILGIVDIFSPRHKRSKIIYRPEKENAREFVHDISKARQELGYKPQYDYVRGLLDFKRSMSNDPFAGLWN